jgi:hypothetical protein
MEFPLKPKGSTMGFAVEAIVSSMAARGNFVLPLFRSSSFHALPLRRQMSSRQPTNRFSSRLRPHSRQLPFKIVGPSMIWASKKLRVALFHPAHQHPPMAA